MSKKNIAPLTGATKNDPLLKLSMKNDIPIKVPFKEGKKLDEQLTKAIINEKGTFCSFLNLSSSNFLASLASIDVIIFLRLLIVCLLLLLCTL